MTSTESKNASIIQIRLLGTLKVVARGVSIHFDSSKAIALFSYLAIQADESFSRDHLAGLLWAESSNDKARANLRQALSQIRRAFRPCGHDPIRTESGSVLFDSTAVTMDVLKITKNSTLPLAEGSIVREFLEGFSIPEVAFEQWLTEQRESLRVRLLRNYEAAAEDSYQAHRFDDAIVRFCQTIRLNPLQEHVHRRLMELYSAQGRSDAALAQFETCRKVLDRELGIAPDQETVEMYNRIVRQRGTKRSKSVAGSAVRVTDGFEPDRFEHSDSPSIVVLPFANRNGAVDQEYFSDGLTEDIMTELSRVSGLFVIARNSAFSYKGKSPDIQRIADELQVQHILQGSVRKAGSRVRITAQLIDVKAGRQVWADRYDRELVDIFSLQDDVTQQIVGALAPRLLSRVQQNMLRRKTNPEAYDYYLRGRQQALLDTRSTNRQAQIWLEKTIQLDPEFSSAIAHLARNYVISYVNGWFNHSDCPLQTAINLGTRAVTLDEDNPFAHFALATAVVWDRQPGRAEAEARTAIAINPGFADGHAALGMILVYAGVPQEAIAPVRAAMRLDPHYRDIFLHVLALAYFHLDRLQEAEASLKERLNRKPESDISRVLLASVYGHMGKINKCRDQWNKALQINPDYSLAYRRKILPYQNPADFEKIVDGLCRIGVN